MLRNFACPFCSTNIERCVSSDCRVKRKRKQASAGLLIIGLQQRFLSSVEAFARTLRVHRRTVQRQWERSARKDRTIAAVESIPL